MIVQRLVVGGVLLVHRINCFIVNPSTRPLYRPFHLQANYKDTASDVNLDDGAKIFEKKFLEKTKGSNKTLTKVRHNVFSNGIRGLEYINSPQKPTDAIITIPKELVIFSDKGLESQLKDPKMRWDVSLTLKLLEECLKGVESVHYGYCQLLTQGLDFKNALPCPPSAAPNALRNWSRQQKDFLGSECGPRGLQLLRIEDEQKQDWTTQYYRLSTQEQAKFTLEQFIWGMEVVYSRSFRGDFVNNVPNQLSTLIVPLAAAALGMNYLLADPSESDNAISIALGLIGFLPLILKNLDPKSNESDAVLLPFIDSANHMEQADSQILFDPLNGEFSLTFSSDNAFLDDKDSNGRPCKQLYISYGTKRDTELLLNYGFLPGVNYYVGMDLDSQRRALMKAFSKK